MYPETTQPAAARPGTASIVRLAIVALLFLFSLGTVIVGFSGALFTDSEAVGDNVFTTGTLDLTAAPTSAAITATNMAPGDEVTAPLTIGNGGTLEFRYSMSGTADNVDGLGLADELTLEIVPVASTAACDDTTSFAGAIYSGPLDPSGFGDSAAGQHAGDRTLAATDSEVLCFRVSLPLATGNAFQGATTTATFTFDAEQTANNN